MYICMCFGEYFKYLVECLYLIDFDDGFYNLCWLVIFKYVDNLKMLEIF